MEGCLNHPRLIEAVEDDGMIYVRLSPKPGYRRQQLFAARGEDRFSLVAEWLKHA
jgi:hypothetical protein